MRVPSLVTPVLLLAVSLMRQRCGHTWGHVRYQTTQQAAQKAGWSGA
jgi:hypothetical protein